MNWFTNLFRSPAAQPPPSSSAKLTQNFVDTRWSPKPIPAWVALTINNRQHGPRQFAKIVVNSTTTGDSLMGHNLKFDRKLKFPITRGGAGILMKVFDKPKGGKVLMTVKTSAQRVFPKDSVEFS